MSTLFFLAAISGNAIAILATLLLAAASLSALAVVMSYVLGWANRQFHVDVDPKVEAVNDALPGANCGGCGYVGCQEYAEAVGHLRTVANEVGVALR